eukprot:scaffold10161_cov84-Isochrysis_galbana.AAC.1
MGYQHGGRGMGGPFLDALPSTEVWGEDASKGVRQGTLPSVVLSDHSQQRTGLHSGSLYPSPSSQQRVGLHSGHLYPPPSSQQRAGLHSGSMYPPPLHSSGRVFTAAVCIPLPLHSNGRVFAASSQRWPGPFPSFSQQWTCLHSGALPSGGLGRRPRRLYPHLPAAAADGGKGGRM